MMNDDDKTLAILWNKEFKDFFSLKKFLKERKRKTDKEKEKKNTHIKGKVASKIEIRQKAFWDELLQYEDRYGRDMLSKFYLVWAEDVKAMLKSELADSAGVSLRTLNNWCKPYRRELIKMGWKPKMKLLPPHIVEFLTEKFCISP